MVEVKKKTLDRTKLAWDHSLVTIIIPAYNHEMYVEQSLLSAINQTYEYLEIIIIDDGSSDATPQIIEKVVNQYANDRDMTFIRQNNQGLSKTLNKALGIAKGRFVQFLASDDAYLPEKTTKCVDVLMSAKASVAGVYTDGYLINDRNERTMRFSDKYLRPLSVNTYKELLLGNWIPALGVLYRKEAILMVGGFDESLKVEDYDFLLRLSRLFEFKAIPDKLFLYRWHGGNFSGNSKQMNEEFNLIREKNSDLKRFHDLKYSIQNKSFFNLVKNISWLNLELLLRSLVRKVQIKHGLQDVSYFEMLHILRLKSFRLAKARLNAVLTSFRGINLGKGAKIYGRIRTVGNNKNICIGNRVVVLGDLTIITPYKYSKNQIAIGDDVVLDNNTTIFSMGGNVYIGNGCFIGPNVIIQANGDVYIDDLTMFASNVSVYANNHITKLDGTAFKSQGNRFIGITIGKNCWVGTGVSILDGASVGENSVVGANCVVKGNHGDVSLIVAKGVMGQDYENHRFVHD